MWFVQSAELHALEERNKDDLTVTSTSNTIECELQRRGAVATQATGSIVLNVEAGKCKGSRWFLTGDLGFIVIKGDKLGLKKTVEVNVDLKKLSSWSFPTEADPREKSNQSMWRDGKDVTVVIKDGRQVVEDPSDIQTHSIITAPGFSLRLTVVPTKGGPYSCGWGVHPWAGNCSNKPAKIGSWPCRQSTYPRMG